MMAKKILIITVLAILLFSSLISPVSSIKIKNTSVSEVKEPDDNKSPGSSLNNPTIYVKVKRIHALEPVDSFDEADFYLKIEINHMGQQTSPKPLKKNDNDICFGDDYNWIASQEIYDNKNVVDITIQLWDRDDEWYDGSDDRLDISPFKDDCSVDIRYDLRTGKWDGDDSGTGHSEGNSGESWDKCEIWFEISHEEGDNGNELKVDANGPYEGNVGEVIELKATATGGKPPYHHWYWMIFDKNDVIKESNSQTIKISFDKEGKYSALIQVRDQKNDYAEDSTLITITDEEEPKPKKKYAVLIAGGTGDDLDDAFENTTEHGYRCFKKLGYTDDQICWLSGKNKKDKADKKTTYSNVKWAITSWLKSRSDENSDCFILLCDHGDPALFGGVSVHPGNPSNLFSVVLPFIFDWWLDDLKYNTLTICVSSCYSGKFIKYISGRSRIIITSTDHDSVSYSANENLFMSEFFDELEKTSSTYKPSYGDAWMAGDYYINGIRKDTVMNPQIDDNSDKKGHGTLNADTLPLGGDGYLALKTYP